MVYSPTGVNIVFHHKKEVEQMDEIRLQPEPVNQVLLRGVLLEAPVFSHENHGKQFDRLILSVQRLSGTYDHLEILAEHEMAAALDAVVGAAVEVEGEIRSFNNHSGQGRRLVISVYARSLCWSDAPPENQVRLTGTVCRPPVYRHTPLGREITDVMLAVERRYRRRDYIPCILWGSVARMAAQCPVGARLQLQGRLQSRSYVKQTPEGPEERTAYEVSAITAQQVD